VALAEDREDELGGAVGQGEVAELVEDDKLRCARSGRRPVRARGGFGLLELVREAGERGEAHPPALVAGADGERCGEHRLAGAAVADEVIDSRSSIQDPSASAASAAIVAWGTLGLSWKRKSSRRLIAGKRASIRRRAGARGVPASGPRS